ncbi:hypothetical protein AM588_10005890 [Phytophthora nicotianae]|uniref:MULE transposase domain-containing protein n=1 Tax=Phytophthora nicotianae TaxID=4792 RepID=A0A0W8DJD9_PHYNI|nr:hypothetical protein AM588_10005890 [Phytophthora nicotianae]
MADGDKAQRNALYSTFGFNPRFQFLMCFFHVMEKVQTAVKSIPSLLSASVLEDVYDLHFVRGHDAFLRLRDTIMKKWEDDPRLYLFSQYMNAQWLQGPFSTWQAYATPCGFATTNNPAETFNALLKRDYTLRRRLKMGTLLREFSSCCQDQSTTARAFAFGVIPSDSLTRRVSELVRARLLSTADAAAGECDGAGRPDIIYVKAMLAPRVIVAPNKRSEQGIAVSAQMGANYARMEVLGQPAGGWPVNIERQWCPCHYCFVFGTCVHVLYALRVTEYLDSCGRAILVSRKKRKRTALTAPDTGGRPRSAGPALSFV